MIADGANQADYFYGATTLLSVGVVANSVTVGGGAVVLIGAGNGIARAVTYDKRGRTSSLTDGSVYNYSLTYMPDSNIQESWDNVNAWGAIYTFDDFSRVATYTAPGIAYNYKYDRYGNRLQQNITTGTGPAPNYTFDANNHLITFSYDAAGNLLNDGTHSYTYDSEGRVLTVDGSSTSYVYDAFGRRAQKTVSGTAYQFIYDESGRVIDELTSGSWISGELYAGATHVATYTGSTTYFDHSDWLGTSRVRSNVSGVNAEHCTNLVFGDAMNCPGTDWSLRHFTGDWHDSESNLEDTWFRKYSTTEGRWTSPDPAGLAAVDPTNPQTWNRYAYVGNNPLSFTDPEGLQRCVPGTPNYENDCATPPPAEDAPPEVCTIDSVYGIGEGSDYDMPQPTGCGLRSNRNLYQYCRYHACPNFPPTGGGGSSAANNSTATIGPPPQPKPGPTGLKKYLTQYVPCAVGEGIRQFWEDDDKAAATVLANIAPLAPANLLKGGPFVYLAITAAYDFSNALQVRQTCTQSVYGGG
jgi:RHS repeat-associated protein